MNGKTNYYELFVAWAASLSNQDFIDIANSNGELNRTAIAKALGCGRRVVNGQNARITEALGALEERLRKEGVLPPLADEDSVKPGNEPKEYDHTERRRNLDSARASKLEVENTELKARVNELERELEKAQSDLRRFKEQREAFDELGVILR
ncbi:VPA1267 family protein [Thalassotalea sp. PS06]|uniref:VPA1267 family protein n=1 Tax=Thalassotalea sp. PS06 TaxID=2594005 RepID=UPI00163D80E2|nr:VPA1267 family protein [Thalassotalea sp. PS06]